jgi:UDP-glucose 4-epimerase
MSHQATLASNLTFFFLKECSMKVIVIGGSGYIGTHICAELIEQGFGVVVVDNYSNSDVVGSLKGISDLESIAIHVERFDVKDTDRLCRVMMTHDIKGVIYAADRKGLDESVSDPSMYYQNNIGNLLSVLSAMDRCKMATKLIYLSSSSVYCSGGEGASELRPIGIDDKQCGDTPYAKTKQVSETLIKDACQFRGDLSAVILRPFSVAGSHPDGRIGEHAIRQSGSPISAMCEIAAKKSGALPVYYNHPTFDSTCIRDYVHVTDVAKAVYAALRLSKNMRGVKTFNVGRGVGVSLSELMLAFTAATSQNISSRRVGKMGNESAYRVADIQSNPLPNWRPLYNLHDICATSWAWQRSRKQCAVSLNT